jgi:hypothetical protein
VVAAQSYTEMFCHFWHVATAIMSVDKPERLHVAVVVTPAQPPRHGHVSPLRQNRAIPPQQ